MKVTKNQKAFTVLELMVVIGIMVMMLVLTVPNFKNFDRSQILETETDTLSSILRQAQILALTGQTVGSDTNNRYNFGVHFIKCNTPASGCQYVFFKDAIGGNKIYDPLATNPSESYGVGIKTMSSGNYISNLKKGSQTDLASLDILFEIPSGQIYFNGVVAGSDNATTTITNLLSGKTRSITVNGESGQINIQ